MIAFRRPCYKVSKVSYEYKLTNMLTPLNESNGLPTSKKKKFLIKYCDLNVSLLSCAKSKDLEIWYRGCGFERILHRDSSEICQSSVFTKTSNTNI